jgi:hypothetical protein
MKSITQLIIGDDGVIAPKVCVDALLSNFKNPVNVEWFSKGDSYEAIFYLDNLEVIALISTNGEVLECKRFIPRETMPDPIKIASAQHGEIMNVVQIENSEGINYEVIVRDESLIRSVIYLDKDAHLIKKMKF